MRDRRRPARGRLPHLRVEAPIRAGLRRPVVLPDGSETRAALDDEDAARATLLSLFEPDWVVEDR